MDRTAPRQRRDAARHAMNPSKGASLPPLLAKGLDVVFIGTEPGPESLGRGEYYANPTNSFYKHLAETGFTPRRLSPTEFRALLDYGIGLDDVYDDAQALRSRVQAAAPLAVCFNSSQALRRFIGVDRLPSPWRRNAAGRYAEFGEALVWATSDSSWNANQHWPARLADLRALRARLPDSRD